MLRLASHLDRSCRLVFRRGECLSGSRTYEGFSVLLTSFLMSGNMEDKTNGVVFLNIEFEVDDARSCGGDS